MKSKLVSVVVAMLVTACATPGPSVKVIEQSDKKPAWATITKTTYRDGDKMKFVGYFTAEGDSRPSAAIHGSGVKAQAMPLQSISDDFFQQAGVAEDMRESSAKLVISTLRKNPPNIPGLDVTGNYYERVELHGSDGNTRSEIRAYSLAECPVGEYNAAKTEALRRLKGDPKIKAELDTLMSEQRDRAYGDRKPASVSSDTPKSSEQAKPSTADSSD